MAANDDLDGISSTTPQFSETAYEIPSWQTPWNKPWYQRFDDHGTNKREQRNDYVSKTKGHKLNCKCARCEEELDSAFSPVSNNSTNFIHVSNKNDKDENSGNHERQEKVDGKSSARSHYTCNDKVKSDANSSQNVRPEKVILLSDLEEVRPNTNGSKPTCEARGGNISSGNASSDSFSANGEMSSMNTDSLFNSLGALATLQSVKDRSKALQEKIKNFRPETDDGRELLILRGLLFSCLAEIHRVGSGNIEWLQTAANMVKSAIERMLVDTEEKIRNNPHCQADNY